MKIQNIYKFYMYSQDRCLDQVFRTHLYLSRSGSRNVDPIVRTITNCSSTIWLRPRQSLLFKIYITEMEDRAKVNKGSQDDAEDVENASPESSEQTHQHQKMVEEFNIQRAKMKELFLQKEEEVARVRRDAQRLECELLDTRQQLQQMEALSHNQRQEIQSLTMLVQETVEASSSESSSARQLAARCVELEEKLAQLTRQHKEQETSLAPSVLVQAVTKSIARKLGADPDKPDTLDDSMKRAQEDAEMLRSLVVPLEEEIKALKDKLRDTDSQLQQALATKHSDSAPLCDMCANYEAQLVAEQAKSADEARKAHDAELAMQMATEELQQTETVHADTLATWKSERDATELELTHLRELVLAAEQANERAAAEVSAAEQRTLQRLTEITVQRETLQEHLDRLQRENAALAGKFSRCARDMQLEDISLPSELEELTLHALQLREELIAACVGREQAVGAEEALRAELQAQAGAVQLHAQRADDLAREKLQLQQQLDESAAERAETGAISERLRDSERRRAELHLENTKLSEQVAELRARVVALQTELDNSEQVQQDFVRLSQSLQVQLERIREADTEVRWQHDDDVSECPACHAALPNKAKPHCRHCGRIFCATCLWRTVASGPRRAPCNVCDVCHTLLERQSRPYFSNEAPQLPD